MPPADSATLIEMARELVRIPSRAGVDPFGPITDAITGWLEKLGLPVEVLRDDSGSPVALVCSVGGPPSTYVLNATFDTAGFGDPSAWSHPPAGAEVVDGWLYGRGAADSKAAIAIFAHVAATLAAEILAAEAVATPPKGRLTLLFDGDEHAGTFRGARAFFEGTQRPPCIDGVMIGYPGNERLVVGSRGFYRVRLIVRGVAAHSGSGSNHGINAIPKAARLVQRLSHTEDLPGPSPDFPLPPKVTVTSINCDGEFSSLADLCEVKVDMRLTPSFGELAAQSWIADAVAAADATEEGPPTQIEAAGSQPPFRTADSAAFVEALRSAGGDVFGRPIPTAIVGPSSVGNYLATLGIPATAGFGVTYRAVHAPDECAELASFQPVYEAYLRAMRSLIGLPAKAT